MGSLFDKTEYGIHRDRHHIVMSAVPSPFWLTRQSSRLFCPVSIEGLYEIK